MARVIKDPPGVRLMGAPPIFDSRPHRNRGMPGIARELDHPNDRLLIATLVAHGQPQWSAEQVRHHPPARWAAVAFWIAVQDAAAGGKAAREKVDYCVWSWREMRRQEMIADVPDHGGQHLRQD